MSHSAHEREFSLSKVFVPFEFCLNLDLFWICITNSKDFFFFFAFFLFRATPSAYGGSQAKGLIGAVAAGLHHSHSNVGSELRLQPTPQPTAMPDP